jgi:predicted nucleotide-binding protein
MRPIDERRERIDRLLACIAEYQNRPSDLACDDMELVKLQSDAEQTIALALDGRAGPDELRHLTLVPYPTVDSRYSRVASRRTYGEVRPRLADLAAHLTQVRASLPVLSPNPSETRGRKDIPPSAVFLIHGHDHAARDAVWLFLQQLGLQAIVLMEQPSSGKAIIEKIEQANRASYAVAILTPDDRGYASHQQVSAIESRARQNVIFEIGLSIGRLGRGRVCLLEKGSVERGSDLRALLTIQMDENGGWKLKLARELQQAEFAIAWDEVR